MVPQMSADSLRELSGEPDWPQRLAGLDACRAAELLAEADALREGSPEERAVALETYRALQVEVDPSDPAGCDRVEWVLNALEAIDQRFDPLLRRAGVSAERAIVRGRSRVALGAFRVAVGDLAEGETLFLGVLSEARGMGVIPERAACLNLCRLYRQQGRSFEGYVMARHAVRLFQAAADPIRELMSEIEVLACLCEMDEWDAFDALLPRIDELHAAMPPEFARAIAPDIFLWRFNAAHARRDLDEALAKLAGLAPVEPGSPSWVHHDGWRKTMRAAVLSDLGRLDESAALFAEAVDSTGGDAPLRFRFLQLQAVCALRRGDDELAFANARALLDRPSGDLVRKLGTGGALRIAVQLARALRYHGHEALAREAFDRAATAAVERIREAGRAVRELPELARVSPEDRTVLARARTRLARERRGLLRALVALFNRAEAAGEPWLAELRAGEHTLVCAWCALIHTHDGTWVPVGHLVPQDGPLVLTHGMCPDCASTHGLDPHTGDDSA